MRDIGSALLPQLITSSIQENIFTDATHTSFFKTITFSKLCFALPKVSIAPPKDVAITLYTAEIRPIHTYKEI